jgi:hypothetical protein
LYGIGLGLGFDLELSQLLAAEPGYAWICLDMPGYAWICLHVYDMYLQATGLINGFVIMSTCHFVV